MITSLRAVLVAVSVATLLAACSDDSTPESEPSDEPPTSSAPASPSDPASSGSTGVPEPRVAGTIATGFTSPWDIAFLPDGDALVSERDTGLIKRVTPDGEVTTVGELPEVAPSSEGGLLGLTVHPDFETEPYVYAYLSTDSDNRLVRMRWDGERLGDPEVLLDDNPVGEIHDGGRLAFGPDGKLYVTTGETGNDELSQDLDSNGGKILRLEPDGDIPPDNPFPDSPVWSYGHRNVEGLAFDDSHRLWASEFGDSTWDELNLIEPGDNYGWPLREGDEGESCDCIDPVEQWSTDDASPSGLAYADGALWMAALAGQRLWRIDIDGDHTIGEPNDYFTGEYGRLRAIAAAPDGSLWLATSNTDGRGDPASDDDRILRIELS
ncbi:MAG TPA: PQQ-dependent sugar dehydrogenase [Nocardioidaceae bacterium]|nr:PQQ-dependent sugar dehydrogenase [Nocardioidaceae bacterium]